MIEQDAYTIYTTPNCPKCKDLKQRLANACIKYDEADMTTAESITELRTNDCFIMEAPVLRIGDRFYGYKDAVGSKEAEKQLRERD